MVKLNMEIRHMLSCDETELTVGEDIVTSRRQAWRKDYLSGAGLVRGRDKIRISWVGREEGGLWVVLVVLVESSIAPRLFVLPLR